MTKSINTPVSYQFHSNNVRIIEKDGEFWFIAKDVCDILDIKNSRNAVSRLDDDEKGVVSTDTLGGKQEMAVVNEFGLYNLILSSRKKSAKEFKRWLTHEVIPTLFKTGRYAMPGAAPDDIQVGIITAMARQGVTRFSLLVSSGEEVTKGVSLVTKQFIAHIEINEQRAVWPPGTTYSLKKR